MLAIYKKEVRSYFTSMLSYIYLGLFMVVVGFYFSLYCVFYGMNDFAYYVLNYCTVIMIMLLPVLTMRTFAEERKNKTDQLLLTAPVSVGSIVIGKFLALFTLFMVSVVLTMIYPLIISLFGTISMPLLVSGYIGFILFGACLLAIGMFISTLTENQFVAAIVTVVVFLGIYLGDSLLSLIPAGKVITIVFFGIIILGIMVLFYVDTKKVLPSVVVGVIGSAAILITYLVKSSLFDNGVATFINWLSLVQRYAEFVNGLVDLSTITYLLSVVGIFLFLSTQVIQKRRWK